MAALCGKHTPNCCGVGGVLDPASCSATWLNFQSFEQKSNEQFLASEEWKEWEQRGGKKVVDVVRRYGFHFY